VDRTLRAALLAALLTGGAVAFFGLFLGFDATGTLVTAAVLAVLAAVLILAAARRADTFADDEVTPPSPGFPGPPDHDDGSPSDPTAPPFRDEE
jgi:hypothetical protein